MNSLPGWPTNFCVMTTSAGLQFFEFRKGDRDLSEALDHRESHANPFTGKTEMGTYYGNLQVYHSASFSKTLQNAKERTIRCLSGLNYL